MSFSCRNKAGNQVPLIFLLGLILFSCSKENVPTSTINLNIKKGFKPDINVQWISRTPKIDYVPGSSDPTVEGWPEVDQDISWNARVKVYGDTTFNEVKYRWSKDGVVLEEGTHTLTGDTVYYFQLRDVWSFERSEIQFDINLDGRFEELTPGNNTVKIYSDALAVGFAVEEVYKKLFEAKLPTHTDNFRSVEDWAQYQMSVWNRLFEEAIYEETPDGVLDRVRLDSLWFVPNGHIGSGPPYHENDRSLDLSFDITEFGDVKLDHYARLFNANTHVFSESQLYDGVLFHEIGHARYLWDIYNYDLDPNSYTDSVLIFENDTLLHESRFTPFLNFGGTFTTQMTGLMNWHYHKIDRFSAIALNRKTGERALFSNTPASAQLESEELSVIPDLNSFRIVDMNNEPIDSAEVKFYLDHALNHYFHKFSEDYYTVSQTDENGWAHFGEELTDHYRNYPFFNDFYTITNPGFSFFKEMTIIARIEKNGKIGYTFFEGFNFTLAYWLESETHGEYILKVDLK